MTERKATKTEGYGKSRFVLGHGASGVFGHVTLLLKAVPDAGQHSVEWQATCEYLRKYVAGHSECGFLATITEVISDPARRNDYERAVNLALRSALEEMGLPVAQIFGL